MITITVLASLIYLTRLLVKKIQKLLNATAKP